MITNNHEIAQFMKKSLDDLRLLHDLILKDYPGEHTLGKFQKVTSKDGHVTLTIMQSESSITDFLKNPSLTSFCRKCHLYESALIQVMHLSRYQNDN